MFHDVVHDYQWPLIVMSAKACINGSAARISSK